MDANLLHVVTCIYNPIRWDTRIRHARRFLAQMVNAGVKVTLVECAMGQRAHELSDVPGIEFIPVRADTMAWNKENLLNIALQRSAIRTPYIAWIDADIEFRNPTWAIETVHALQQYKVVQPWGEAIDLGPRGEPMFVKGFHVQTSFGKVWHHRREIKATPANTQHPQYSVGWAYPHPGYAWAIRRDTLNQLGGFIEASGLGAGDHQMAMAFIGRVEDSLHGQTNQHYQAMIRGWAERAAAIVQADVSYVEGTVEHWFHGEKAKRKYQERWDILVEENFNPLTDIRKNLDGVIELSGNKPRLRHKFDWYFRQRDEDANIRLGE